MRPTLRRWLPYVALASLLLPAAAALAAPPAEARGWLARIQQAATGANYQGVLVFSAPGMLSSARIAHFVAGDQAWERMETLDGRAQHVYRANEVVHTLWPQRHVASIERRDALSSLPSSTQSVEPRALERYDMRIEGAERIAGREAQVLLLLPRDALRYAQRLWADIASGLMLPATGSCDRRSTRRSSRTKAGRWRGRCPASAPPAASSARSSRPRRRPRPRSCRRSSPTA
jgi:sigma-E factor negative regulatory protein RseB